MNPERSARMVAAAIGLSVASLAVAGEPRVAAKRGAKPAVKMTEPAGPPPKVPARKAVKPAERRPAALERKALGLGCASGED